MFEKSDERSQDTYLKNSAYQLHEILKPTTQNRGSNAVPKVSDNLQPVQQDDDEPDSRGDYSKNISRFNN